MQQHATYSDLYSPQYQRLLALYEEEKGLLNPSLIDLLPWGAPGARLYGPFGSHDDLAFVLESPGQAPGRFTVYRLTPKGVRTGGGLPEAADAGSTGAFLARHFAGPLTPPAHGGAVEFGARPATKQAVYGALIAAWQMLRVEAMRKAQAPPAARTPPRQVASPAKPAKTAAKKSAKTTTKKATKTAKPAKTTAKKATKTAKPAKKTTKTAAKPAKSAAHGGGASDAVHVGPRGGCFTLRGARKTYVPRGSEACRRAAARA